jgi:hypothetical protein
MYFFHQFYFNYQAFSLEYKVLNLQSILVDRLVLNNWIKELQDLQKLRQSTDSGQHIGHPITTFGWKEEELESLMKNGLTCLSEDRLDWLSFNPIALFQAHEAIIEKMPSAWINIILNDTESLQEERLMDITLTALATNQEALYSHIRNLQKNKAKAITDFWVEKELDQVLEQGVKALTLERQQWLYKNPVALWQLFDMVHEEFPTAWMPAIEADVRRLSIDNSSLSNKPQEHKLSSITNDDGMAIAATVVPPNNTGGDTNQASRSAAMAKKTNFNYEDVIRFLTENPDRDFTYGKVASELGFGNRSAQAVGSAMNRICSKGLHEFCIRVTDQKGQHHCKVR